MKAPTAPYNMESNTMEYNSRIVAVRFVLITLLPKRQNWSFRIPHPQEQRRSSHTPSATALQETDTHDTRRQPYLTRTRVDEIMHGRVNTVDSRAPILEIGA
eukprot:scaffold52862_cov30-Tisochrysis_lutea.AAC.1